MVLMIGGLRIELMFFNKNVLDYAMVASNSAILPLGALDQNGHEECRLNKEVGGNHSWIIVVA